MSAGSPGYLRFLPAIYARPGPDGQPSFLTGYLPIAEGLLDRTDVTAYGVQAGIASNVDVLSSLLYARLSFLFPGSTDTLPPVLILNQDGSINPLASAPTLRLLNDHVGVVPVATSNDPSDTSWETEVLAWLGSLLAWLSEWLAFQGDPAWSVDQQRAALIGLMPLYRARGTKAGIEGIVKLFFGQHDIRIVDLAEAVPLALGETSTLSDTFASGDGVLDGRRPYSFSVDIVVDETNHGAPEVVALQRSVTALIEAEKPLQTRCVVRVGTTFTIGKYSTIGRDTRIPKTENAT